MRVGSFLAGLRMGIGDGDKLHTRELCVLRSVMTAERAGADDGSAKRFGLCAELTTLNGVQHEIPLSSQRDRATRERQWRLIKYCGLLPATALPSFVAINIFNPLK